MAAKNKTNVTNADVVEFIQTFANNDRKISESLELLELMEKWSGYKAKMWGPSIIGFGAYHYKYASGHEGDAPIIGFSPRKAAFSLYVYTPLPEIDELLEQLGKFKQSKACTYVNKLSDIDLSVLEKICKISLRHFREKYVCTD